MLEEIRCYMMERQHTKLSEMCQVHDTICPIVRNKLELNKYHSRSCVTRPAVGAKFQVTHGEDQFVVDLKNWTCTCRVWELSGIPCVHACSSIHFLKKDAVDYVDAYYSTTKYIDAYSLPLEPINGKSMWPRAEGTLIKPPPIKSMPGRPKKKRVKQPDEDKKRPRKMSRNGIQMTCTRCAQVGHNSRTCTSENPLPPKVPKKRGRPRKSQTSGSHAQTARERVVSRKKQKSAQPISPNIANEIRQVRKGYGVRHFDSGRVYMRMPENNKVRIVHGPKAVAEAAKASNESSSSTVTTHTTKDGEEGRGTGGMVSSQENIAT